MSVGSAAVIARDGIADDGGDGGVAFIVLNVQPRT